MRPIVKWAGGKRQLLPELRAVMPREFSVYVEPFVGGGAVLLDRKPRVAVMNDANTELMNVYRVVRDRPRALVDVLRAHEARHSRDYFYQVRALDRDVAVFRELSDVERAARFIYLNKTCYNGLYRVNRRGQFNAPYGHSHAPRIVDEGGIRVLSEYLNESDVQIACGDYQHVLKGLPSGAFVYMDPPYMPVSPTSTFTSYTSSGFDYSEQVRLRDECVKLREQGVGFLQSNSDTPQIRCLYEGFTIRTVHAKRSINSHPHGRGRVSEVLISA